MNYLYKGFEVHYKVTLDNNTHFYKADGYISTPSHSPKKVALSQKFHTEHKTKNEATEEIKKLLQNYIDFEWKEFHAMEEE